MPATKSGVYHNLRESKYTVSNTEIVFFFSSELYMLKFMNGYKNFRDKYAKRIANQTGKVLNFDTLADIEYYLQVEKRGFFVRLHRAKITKDGLYKYALRKMTEKESLDWVRN